MDKLYTYSENSERTGENFLSDTLWVFMGISDTFKKDTEKGEAVVIKSRSDSHFSPNRSELTHRNLPETGEILVRITHIMLKKRFYLTSERTCDILALLIRIEES